jgi:outer membrane protein assembly factor BamB
MLMRQLPCVILACVAGFGSLATGETNWPQFRGPTGQGISDAKGVALTWSETQNVKWKTPIHGKAWSSPVIWGSQVWVTTATEDGHELSVLCLDKDNGKVLIDKVLFHIDKPQYCHPFNSYASPTPVIEEGRIYVTFGSPGTACLDTKDGTVLWERTDFVCNHFRGAGSSPLMWNDLLVMDFDGSDFQFVAALDKKTGKTVWKTDRSIDFKDMQPNGKPLADGDMHKAFSTPRMIAYNGRQELISEGSNAVYSYDPATGKELWHIEERAAHSGSATPVIGDGLVYISTGHGKTELWALRPGGSGLVGDGQVAWKVKKHVPTRSSAILVDGLLYFISDIGTASCVDAKTGQEAWHSRIDGSYSASPIYADGRVYFFNESGKATVVAAGREFKVLAENQLDAGFMSCAAVSGEALFIRTKGALYRIEGHDAAPAASPAAAETKGGKLKSE